MTRINIGERYRIEPLTRKHDRKGFTCGVPALDLYFQKQASQDARKKVSTVFVAVDNDTDAVHGFYTLSTAGIPLDRLPAQLSGKLSRYPSLPAILLGRMAVHKDAQGQQLGSYLLMDAFQRILFLEIGWVIFLVDAKDDTVLPFYKRFEFQSFEDNLLDLYLLRSTIENMFGKSG